MTILNKPIKEAVPHIFKWPLLSVGPSDSLLHAGTFLALGSQIYIDGLVVLDQDLKDVGIIGGRHTLLNISYHTASQIGQLHQLQALWLHTFDSAVEADSPLTSALDVFTEIEFAFVSSAGAARLFDVNVPCRLQIKKLKSDAVGHCNERSKENRKIQQEMWVQLASISTLLEYSSIQKI